jgi:hypothetical protein
MQDSHPADWRRSVPETAAFESVSEPVPGLDMTAAEYDIVQEALATLASAVGSLTVRIDAVAAGSLPATVPARPFARSAA